MYTYKTLNDISYDEIAKCLNLAFSDYYLPLQLSEKELETHFQMTGVDTKLSYGAFLNNEMVGFIFNSCNTYNKQKVVFDVGTGVIPEHRGNKVFTNLFKFTEQELQKHQIEKYYLEVLQQNDRAINSYKKQGFTISREFSILKSSDYIKETANINIDCKDFHDFDFNNISHCNYVQPSYEHSTNILKRNSNSYSVAYKQKNNKISAFCVFSKKSGHIFQLGYSDILELKLIIQYLLSKFNNIIVKNIDLVYSEVLEMFYSIGFIEVCKQFEMTKDICVN